MLQVPHRLMAKGRGQQRASLWGGPRDYGVGMFFLPEDALKRAQAKKMMEIITAKEGMEFLGWRDVPTHPEVLGQKAPGLHAPHQPVLHPAAGGLPAGAGL